MSLFKKMLATIRIGSAKVDTRLENTKYHQGEEVKGVIHIQGGDVEQKIGDVYIKVYTQYLQKIDDHKVYKKKELLRYKVKGEFLLGKDEVLEIPFTFHLPHEVPITIGQVKVWIHTELGIDLAIDPIDKDYISISPSPVMEAFFAALESLGFRIYKAECKHAKYRYGSSLPFLQEFELKPYHGEFHNRLDEIEVTLLNQNESQAEVYLQIDRKARGMSGLLSEILDTDETNLRMILTKSDIPYMKQKIRELLHRHS